MSNQSKSVVQNQFGEKSIGVTLPINGANGPIYIMPTGQQIFCGVGAPSQTAPIGSIYFRSDGVPVNQLLYVNTNGSNAWSAVSLDGSLIPSVETIAAAGALSTTIMESIINNATGGSYAVTLAAPSNQDGQMKIIKMNTATHTATLAMTNIAIGGGYTARGTTTLTFTATGDSAILVAVGAKWAYLGGSAIAS